MFPFCLFVLASVGLTAILVDGKIFSSFREKLIHRADFLRSRRERLNLQPTFNFTEYFEGILTCYQCCGFWSGLFCGLFLLTTASCCPLYTDPKPPFALLNTALLWFCCGAVGSLSAHLYLRLVELLYATEVFLKQHHLPHHHHGEGGDSEEELEEES